MMAFGTGRNPSGSWEPTTNTQEEIKIRKLTINADWDNMVFHSNGTINEPFAIEASKAEYESLVKTELAGCGVDEIEFDWCEEPQYSFVLSNNEDLEIDELYIQQVLEKVWQDQSFWIYI